MHMAVKSSIIHHFADDTNLLFSSKCPKEITKILNKELKLLFEWLCANRLSLNVAKTEFIIFRPPNRPLQQRIVLKLNGSKIYESTKIKYLGIILDPRLLWKYHTNELTKKLNCAVGMIYKIRHDCTNRFYYLSITAFFTPTFHMVYQYGERVMTSKLTLLQK